MKRVCFLFNHDEGHQVAHALPIAMALGRSGALSVTLAVANSRTEEAVRAITGDNPPGCEIVIIGLNRAVSKAAVAMVDRFAPLRKLAVLNDNLAFLRTFDAIVVAEKTSLRLKTQLGLKVPLIHTRHGAGDRAIGFNRSSRLFDLTLVAGPKVQRRLIRDSGVAPERLRVVGYPKFDLCRDNRAEFPFDDPARPVALYNPHPSPRFSSWYASGQRLLDEAGESDRVNLMFAPHVMMFRRRWTITVEPPALTRNRLPVVRPDLAGSVAVDLGSAASSNMSYTNAAQLYIGDVSSQVYEFLLHPRPCLFVDAHDTNWQGNSDYAHWQAGPVVRPTVDFGDAIAHALDTHDQYLDVQRRLFEDTFSVTDVPAAERGALAIAEFLDQSA